MRIKVLAENTSKDDMLGSEHGLSLYIETKKHKLLFDTGASDLFARNAVRMKIDLSKVDLAVLSHGHYDHGGGLEPFLSIHASAPVYVRQKAFEKHYSKRPDGTFKYNGLDETLLTSSRFVFTKDQHLIDEELTLFSAVKGNLLTPSGNKNLFMGDKSAPVLDDFSHEQNLVIRECGKTLLIAGCAHRGIVNILEHFHALYGSFPDDVIGGFHLYNIVTNQSEPPSVLSQIAQYLLGTNAVFHTCHCTGLESYRYLKTLMGEKIAYLSTGDEFIL